MSANFKSRINKNSFHMPEYLLCFYRTLLKRMTICFYFILYEAIGNSQQVTTFDLQNLPKKALDQLS